MVFPIVGLLTVGGIALTGSTIAFFQKQRTEQEELKLLKDKVRVDRERQLLENPQEKIVSLTETKIDDFNLFVKNNLGLITLVIGLIALFFSGGQNGK